MKAKKQFPEEISVRWSQFRQEGPYLAAAAGAEDLVTANDMGEEVEIAIYRLVKVRKAKALVQFTDEG